MSANQKIGNLRGGGTHEGRGGVRDNVDALDGLVKGTLAGDILDDRPLELALLVRASVLLLPSVGLVLRADGSADADEGAKGSVSLQMIERLGRWRAYR